MARTILEIAIYITLALTMGAGALGVYLAWCDGDEYKIKGNKGYRLSWVERLNDGIEKLKIM